MNRLSLPVLGLLVLATLSASGCSLCCSPYNDDYLTYGSRTPRLDMKNGRVGSILSDPQLSGQTYAAESSDGVEYEGEMDETIILDDEAISLGTGGE
jgi:hypothetical protein